MDGECPTIADHCRNNCNYISEGCLGKVYDAYGRSFMRSVIMVSLYHRKLPEQLKLRTKQQTETLHKIVIISLLLPYLQGVALGNTLHGNVPHYHPCNLSHG